MLGPAHLPPAFALPYLEFEFSGDAGPHFAFTEEPSSQRGVAHPLHRWRLLERTVGAHARGVAQRPRLGTAGFWAAPLAKPARGKKPARLKRPSPQPCGAGASLVGGLQPLNLLKGRTS